jgi:hypothetical protein
MSHPLRLRHFCAAVLAALVFTTQGCSSGSDTTSGGSITLTLSPTSATVQVGASTVVTGTIVRTSFTGDVGIAVQNAPSGVTGTVTAFPVNGSNSASVSLLATAAATPGTYTMTVVASGSGISNATATFTLTIAAATTSGSYAIALASSPTSIAQGGTGSVTVNFTRTSFTGNITPSVDNLPTGVTAAFTQNPVVGNGSLLTFTVASTAAAGVYSTLDVRGAAAGLTDVTSIPFTLTITSAGGTGSVHLDYSACTVMPIWVAAQDGSGAWTHLTGTNNVYTFNVTSGKGGYAAVMLSGGIYTTTVNYFSQAELTGATAAQCVPPPVGSTINGTVAGLNANDVANISMGSGSTVAPYGLSAFQLTNVQSGPQTLVGYRRSTTTPGTNDMVILRPGQNIASGGSLALVDFGSAEAFSPSPGSFTVAGGTPGDTFITSMAYFTGACVSSPLYSTSGTYAVTPTVQYGIPTAQQAATDLHRFTAQDQNVATATSFIVSTTFHTFGPQSLTLPAALPAGTITTPSGGIGTRRQIALTLPSDYSTVGFSYSDATFNTTNLFASAAYLGGSAVTLAMPDFTAAGSYLAIYGPGAGALTTTLFATGATGAACTNGATTRIAFMTGTN